MRICVVAGLLTLMILGPVPSCAFAQSTGRALAELCRSNYPACAEVIVQAEFAILSQDLNDGDAKHACYVPSGVEFEDGTRTIAVWLTGHAEINAVSTEDAVETAIKSIWRCAAAVDGR